MSPCAISAKIDARPAARSAAVATGTQGSSLSSGRSSAASCFASARSSSPETCTPGRRRRRSPRFSRSSSVGRRPTSATSMRTMSPKRRRCSSSSTASSRSSASSETSKSASRVTRKAAHSRISICGKSESRKWAITCSSGRKRPRLPTSTKRGIPSGTLTRAKRSSPGLGVADEDPEAERERRRCTGTAGRARPRAASAPDRSPARSGRSSSVELRLRCSLRPCRSDALGGERRQQLVRPEPRLPRVELLDARCGSRRASLSACGRRRSERSAPTRPGRAGPRREP